MITGARASYSHERGGIRVSHLQLRPGPRSITGSERTGKLHPLWRGLGVPEQGARRRLVEPWVAVSFTLTVPQLVPTVISTFPTAPLSTAACAAAASWRR